MYKLKDIFTLNLNSSGGGLKLFNKIANRYNLNKEDRKDLMNVEVGGGSEKTYYYKIDPKGFINEVGGGSEKTYYYKIDPKGFINEVGEDTVEQVLGVFGVIYHNAIGYITNERMDDVRGRYYLSGAPNINDMLSFNRLEGIIVTDAAPCGMTNPLLIYGNIFERIDTFLRVMNKMNGDDEGTETMLSLIRTYLKYFTEITKEEFFAMNDDPFVDIDDYLNQIN